MDVVVKNGTWALKASKLHEMEHSWMGTGDRDVPMLRLSKDKSVRDVDEMSLAAESYGEESVFVLGRVRSSCGCSWELVAWSFGWEWT